MKIIIGNTGLVGTTVCEQEHFDHFFNSNNINEFINIVEDGDELFLCCLPATKWVVNQNPQKDRENINKIFEIISCKKYSQVILISTIDVYNTYRLKSNENFNMFQNMFYSGKLDYGGNRFYFESLNKLLNNNLKIFRLPALYNKHIKKNILYDLINNNNVNKINANSSFQWYNLDNLSRDIKYYLEKYPHEQVFNLFTEPIDTQEIVNLFPEQVNEVSFLESRIEYDYTTKFSPTGYIDNKEKVLNDIKKFINEFSPK